MKSILRAASLASIFAATLAAGCSRGDVATATPSGPADSSFTALAREIIDDHLQRNPSGATDLGVHKYDDHIEDYSSAGIGAASTAMKGFRTRLAAVDTASLSVANKADRDLLIGSMDAGILANDVIKQWTSNPDNYSSGITNAAY